MIRKTILALALMPFAAVAATAGAQENAIEPPAIDETATEVASDDAEPLDQAVLESALPVDSSPRDDSSDAGTGPVAADDEAPLTVLDQVVPVAEEPEAGALEAGPPGPKPDDPEAGLRAEIMAQFSRYKDLRDRGVLDEAENVAKSVVEMSIRLSGPTSNDTAKALSNLAIVQHQTRDYEAAQQNFQAAIEIIEDNEDRLNAMLVNPLKGLGAAQLEGGRPDLAFKTYQRAVHLSHVNEGPHNLEQVDILEALAETNLRLGEVEQAKDNHDMIYALNLRYFNGNAMEIVPSLIRRAKWQRRTGYILDERATYRRVIRIIETSQGKDDLDLIEPLMELGESYFYLDQSEAATFQSASVASGELYFKRAVRIAEDNPESTWQFLAETRLALGDYYNYRADIGRARKSYRDAWAILSESEDRHDARRNSLERLVALNADPIPTFVGGASRDDRQSGDQDLREGRIIVSYGVNTRGRVTGLKIVEAEPKEFEEIRRAVQREMRTRIFRPRFEDGEPVDTLDQAFTHTFFYRQEELDRMRAEAEANKT